MVSQQKTNCIGDTELPSILRRAKVSFVTMRPKPRDGAGEVPGSKMEQLEELLRQYHLYQNGVDYPCGIYNYCLICPGGANCCAKSLLRNHFLRV